MLLANILLVCIPLLILGSFMALAFYMGYKAGRLESIEIKGEGDIFALGEDADKVTEPFADDEEDDD